MINVRTPEVYYFKNGYVKFKKIDGRLYYETWLYRNDGLMSHILDKGEVKDGQHLKELQSLGSVKT